MNFVPKTNQWCHMLGRENLSVSVGIDLIDSSQEKLVLYMKNPLDHLVLNGFHACSEYFEAGDDHFTLFGFEF